MPKIVHHLIADTAKAMAQELYEELAHDNVFYQNNPDQTKFVDMMYPLLLEQARAMLATMLGEGYPEHLKPTIMDALTKDNTLPRGRNISPAKRQLITGA